LFSSNFFILVDKSVISCEALRRTYLPTLSHLRQANCPHAENGERCSLALQAAADSHVTEDPLQKYEIRTATKLQSQSCRLFRQSGQRPSNNNRHYTTQFLSDNAPSEYRYGRDSMFYGNSNSRNDNVFSTTKRNTLVANSGRKPRVGCGNLTSFSGGY